MVASGIGIEAQCVPWPQGDVELNEIIVIIFDPFYAVLSSVNPQQAVTSVVYGRP